MSNKLLLLILLLPASLHTSVPLACYRPIPVVDPAQVKCLAATVYGEARGESMQGKVAVAYTAINRVGKKSVCQVVLQPKQYSIFNNNPELRAAAMSAHIQPRQKNVIDKQNWSESIQAAELVLKRLVKDPTNGATHYLAPIAMKSLGYKYPAWSYAYTKTAVIDRHVFFKNPKAA